MTENGSDDTISLLGASSVISKLSSRLDRLQAAFYETITASNSFHTEYKSHVSTDFFERFNELEDDMNKSLHRLAIESDDNVHTPVMDIMYKKTSALLMLSNVFKTIGKFDETMEMDILDSASSIQDADTMLDQLKKAAKQELIVPQSLGLIMAAYREKRAKLIAFLEMLFQNMYKLTLEYGSKSLLIKKRVYVENQSFKATDVVKAFETLDYLDEVFKNFGTKLVNEFVHPIFMGQLSNPENESSKSSRSICFSIKKKLAVSSSGELHSSSISTVNRKQIVDNFRCFIEVLADDALDPLVRNSLARCWSDELCLVLKDCYLAGLIPDSYQQVEQFKRDITPEILELERWLMVEKNILHEAYTDLSDYVANIYSHYAKKKRSQLLSMVRDVLVNDDKNTSEVEDATERGGIKFGSQGKPTKSSGKGGKASLLIDETMKLPRMLVSSHAQTVVETAYQILSELELISQAPNPKSAALETYFAARDIFEIWKAISWENNRSSLEENAHDAALFQNDCIYLVYHLSTLAHHSGIPKHLDESFSFVDLIPDIREQGECVFRGQIINQTQKLLDIVDKIDGFESISQPEVIKKIDSLIEQLNYILDNLSKQWKKVLPTEFYANAFGLVLDQVFQKIVTDLSERRYVKNAANGNDAMHQTRYFISKLTSSVPKWFMCKPETYTNANTDRLGVLPISKFVNSFAKLEGKIEELRREASI